MQFHPLLEPRLERALRGDCDAVVRLNQIPLLVLVEHLNARHASDLRGVEETRVQRVHVLAEGARVAEACIAILLVLTLGVSSDAQQIATAFLCMIRVISAYVEILHHHRSEGVIGTNLLVHQNSAVGKYAL